MKREILVCANISRCGGRNLNVSMNFRFYDDHRIKIVEVHLEEYVFKKTHLRVNICVHLANVNLEEFAKGSCCTRPYSLQ